jgi:site-specific DNA-methyltransferase (adenine-specific)
MNKLYFGDNLEVMRNHLDKESVDLIYLDPPFNSKKNYNMIYKEKDDSKSQSQAQAFTDTWVWNDECQLSYDYLISNSKVPQNLTKAIMSFHDMLGRGNSLLPYLVMMSIRLLELKRVLKDTGSIYLHCDPSASHYLKIIMDTVFGENNFQNEIVWHFGLGAFNKKMGLPSKHDIILFYSKTKNFKFNMIRGDITPQMKAKYCHEDEDGFYMLSYGKKYYLKGGKPLDDVWEIATISPTDKQRLGYPTQKPMDLLARIINMSSNKGDVVLDPFCGCGTSCDASAHLEREFIGIDITYLAIKVIIKRLKMNRPNTQFKVIGAPQDLESAKYLAERNKKEFEKWAVSYIDGKPLDTGDGGVDGIINYNEKGMSQPIKVVIQVKGGAINPGFIRDFARVIEREKAYCGVFITLIEPTQGMRTEATTSGYADETNDLKDQYDENKIPRLQIITIKELFEGKKPLIPFKSVLDKIF